MIPMCFDAVAGCFLRCHPGLQTLLHCSRGFSIKVGACLLLQPREPLLSNYKHLLIEQTGEAPTVEKCAGSLSVAALLHSSTMTYAARLDA